MQNNGVCIEGTTHSTDESDYYETLLEVIELEFQALPIKRIILFKCDWYDPTLNSGTIIHPRYKLVDVHKRKRFNKYEPFVLAAQASQVYFCKYPDAKRDRIH